MMQCQVPGLMHACLRWAFTYYELGNGRTDTHRTFQVHSQFIIGSKRQKIRLVIVHTSFALCFLGSLKQSQSVLSGSLSGPFQHKVDLARPSLPLLRLTIPLSIFFTCLCPYWNDTCSRYAKCTSLCVRVLLFNTEETKKALRSNSARETGAIAELPDEFPL